MTIAVWVQTCFTCFKPNANIFTKILFFTLDGDFTKATGNRLKYVYRGPPKDTGKKLYYIYGTKVSDDDQGVHHRGYKPQGKGYNWRESYRKMKNLYYKIVFKTIGKAV